MFFILSLILVFSPTRSLFFDWLSYIAENICSCHSRNCLVPKSSSPFLKPLAYLRTGYSVTDGSLIRFLVLTLLCLDLKILGTIDLMRFTSQHIRSESHCQQFHLGPAGYHSGPLLVPHLACAGIFRLRLRSAGVTGGCGVLGCSAVRPSALASEGAEAVSAT